MVSRGCNFNLRRLYFALSQFGCVGKRLAGGFGLDSSSFRFSSDPAVIAAYDTDPLVHNWGTPRLAAEVEKVRAELYRRAGQWRVPLLMLHGGGDRVCLADGARAFAQQVPAALVTYREFEGLYHEIHNEREQAQIFGAIEAWLAARLTAG